MKKRIYVIRTRHLVTGNHYYFSKLVNVNGVPVAKNCGSTHMEKCAVFSSIAEACTVVREIDRCKWRCLIRPANHLSSFARARLGI